MLYFRVVALGSEEVRPLGQNGMDGSPGSPEGEWKSGGTGPPRITDVHCTHHYICTICMYSKGLRQ